MSTDKRVPAGIPTGGQFAAQQRSEADVNLAAAAPDFPVFPELNRRRRAQKFFTAEMKKWPALRSTEHIPVKEKTIVGHFFAGPYDCYVAEYDPMTGEAFAFVSVGGRHDDGEWGTIGLRDVEAANIGPLRQPIERDAHWTKAKAGSCIPKYQAQLKAETDAAARLVDSFKGEPGIHLGSTPARELRTDLMIDDEVRARLGRRELSDVTALAICRYGFDDADCPELRLLGASGHGDRATVYAELQKVNARRSEMRPSERNRVDMLFTWVLHGGDNA